MTIVKGLIFDLGKVVFDVSFDRTFDFWAKASGKQMADLKRAFQFDDIYKKFETGEITAGQFRKLLSEKLNISLPDDTFDQGWCSLYLDTYDEVESLLGDLKANYKLVALTNTNEIHEKIWTVKYEQVLKNFEKVFSSHYINTRKPDEQAFRIVLNYLKMQPRQTIFIDDNADNIRSASKLGIKTVLAVSPRQTVVEIKKLLKQRDI